ncbi:hypothetical protein SGRIM128S_02321 [Streptomyces griseomycini]|nr:hypothetical protein GCM10015536_70620 [Streptomyces griseomycini]
MPFMGGAGPFQERSSRTRALLAGAAARRRQTKVICLICAEPGIRETENTVTRSKEESLCHPPMSSSSS